MALTAKRVARLRAWPGCYGDGHPAVPMMISRPRWLTCSRSAPNHYRGLALGEAARRMLWERCEMHVDDYSQFRSIRKPKPRILRSLGESISAPSCGSGP